MSKKLPWYKFFPADWINDPNLSKCTPATRGIWKDLICAMHQSDRSGKLCGTTDQLARLARCSAVELAHALSELQSTETADVTFRNEFVTVINRKMYREAKSRLDTASRVQKHRSNKKGNDGETPKRSEVKRQKTDLLKIEEGWNCYPDAKIDIALNEIENGGTREWMATLRQVTLSTERIDQFFSAFLLKLTGEKFYTSRGDLLHHFRNWLKDQKIESGPVEKSVPQGAAPLKKLLPN